MDISYVMALTTSRRRTENQMSPSFTPSEFILFAFHMQKCIACYLNNAQKIFFAVLFTFQY